MTHWTERYVGVPYLEFGREMSGADCWGIVCLAYQGELELVLPDYVQGYVTEDERAELAAIISGTMVPPLWIPVQEAARPFDIAIFRRGRLDMHVGLVVHDGLMLHSAREDCAKIETYRTGAWSHRLAGIYRHRDMVSKVR